MIVKVNPLTRTLVRKLIALAGTSFEGPAVDRFLAEAGWVDSVCSGIDIGGGHLLWRAGGGGPEAESVWVPFCWVDDDAGLIGAERWDHWADGPDDQSGFDAAWEQGFETVMAELGPPELAVRRMPDSLYWNLAVWQVESVAIIVAQSTDGFVSQGDLELAAIWLFENGTCAGLPAADDFYSWLVEGKPKF